MESVSDELEQSFDMLSECVRISLREGQLTLPGDFCNAVNDIICFMCTVTVVHRLGLVYSALLCILFLFCFLFYF